MELAQDRVKRQAIFQTITHYIPQGRYLQ